MSVPDLPDDKYPFGTDLYPLADLVMHEPPAAIRDLLVAQAAGNGFEIRRDEIVELTCRGGEMEGKRCQTALNIDPGSASKIDPIEACGVTPLISPAKRVGVAQPG